MRNYAIINYTFPGDTRLPEVNKHDLVTITSDDDNLFPAIVELYKGVLHLPPQLLRNNYDYSVHDTAIIWYADWPSSGSRLAPLYRLRAVIGPGPKSLEMLAGANRFTRGEPIKYGQYWRDITELLDLD